MLKTPFQQGEKVKADKTAENRKKKKYKDSLNGDEDEPDLENMDWWSKYHASVETMIQVTYCCLYHTLASIIASVDIFVVFFADC